MVWRSARHAKLKGTGAITVDVDDYLFPQPSDAQGWAPATGPPMPRLCGPCRCSALTPTTRSPSRGRRSFRDCAVRASMRAPGSGYSRGLMRDASRSSVPNTVGDAVDVMLRVSENNVAEVLFRQVALARGYPATWSGSSAAAGEALRELGLSTWRLKLVDGSGLSGRNRLTAASLTEVLDIALGRAV